MELLKQLQELGFPLWFIIATGIILVLATFGLLNPIGFGISKFSSYIAKRVEAIQKAKQQIELTEAQTKKLTTLREDYSNNWLMEQVTTNQAESLVQLGDANGFIRDTVDKKLDVIEQGVIDNKIEIQTIKQEQENMNQAISKFFTEQDITNRHMEELKEMLKDVLRRIQ